MTVGNSINQISPVSFRWFLMTFLGKIFFYLTLGMLWMGKMEEAIIIVE
jgi:hypothetical protein